MNTPITLTQFLLERLADHPEQRDLTLIVSALANVGKSISIETNRAGLAGILGTTGNTNVQGEHVAKLDVLANEKCKEYLKQTGLFAALASEEEEHVVDMEADGENAKYIIAFDPLDGSSNIDVNVSIGTIFSVHKRLENIDRTDSKQFFQKGKDQVLAGYILYGTSTVMVFSFGESVHEFTLEPALGEFFLSQQSMRIPAGTKMYSANDAYVKFFNQKDKTFINALRDSGEWKSRYIGSMVADVHRTLIKGGVFLYPGQDDKGAGVYKGKLRMNYELKPMAFLIEHAGGRATDGEGDSILEIEPTELHERRSFIAGSKEIIEMYERS